MKNLSNAEICVETRFSIESGNNDGNWFRLADYSSLTEFYIDCAGWFSDEEKPEYVYAAWDNIPDSLINENWICPNIFEVRDALQSIDDGLLDTFLSWCKTYGWDITTDDPYKVVSDFQYAMSAYPVHENDIPEQEEYEPDNSDDDLYTCRPSVPGYNTEIFDENYN